MPVEFLSDDQASAYGSFPGTGFSRAEIDLQRITRHWEDILRVIASIHTGTVRAHEVIRMLSRDGNPTPLGEAIAHYGRIHKTLHVLRMADEPGYRRTMKAQGNVQEGRHALGRDLFHGRRGAGHRPGVPGPAQGLPDPHNPAH
ncbi:Tn3 family transposase [Actinoallomurus sp. NPDC050550]|uniref:Tn3 family transposase n=1 Tax=Actinoallomurus sp. NPDC050550 TaxID=3154937 RepID=UPI0033E79793